MPVSTTSRAARQATASSIPNRSPSFRNRPISSASFSLYRPQPSTYAAPTIRAPSRRNVLRLGFSISSAIWKWWPGTAS
jgi:hypothetical protein